MRSRGVLAVLLVGALAGPAAPASAARAPYVRVEYGATLMRMTDANSFIRDQEQFFRSYGFPAEFRRIGPSYGPGVAAGFWLARGFRVGATVSYQRALRHNDLDLPPYVFWSDDLDLRLTEIGLEAAVRFERPYGLTIGANVGQGRAGLTEVLTIVDSYGQYYHHRAEADRQKLSVGGYVGIDQTNLAGFAGFFRAGFRYCDMGRMPSHIVATDGVLTAEGDSRTVWMDYSGFYVKFGVGYDGGK